MVEYLRLFKGATELSYNSASIERTNSSIVDKANISIKPDSAVTNSSVIDFRKKDGTTSKWQGRVQEIKNNMLWDIWVLGEGYELYGVKVENVYTSISPEDLVQDIVDNYTTNLTFASTESSGITISKYIADAYAIDIIKDMMVLLQWQLRIDESGNVYFNSPGVIDNKITFTEGTNCKIEEWSEDKTDMVNSVKIIGGFESFQTTETISGTGTTFTLSHKPNSIVKAVVSSSEVSPDDFTVNAQDKQIVFDSSKTDPDFTYEYLRPVVVADQNDTSINTHGRVHKDVPAPWLTDIVEARQYVKKYLSNYSEPAIKVKLMVPDILWDLEPNEKLTVVDDVRGKNEVVIITKISFDMGNGMTVIEAGSRPTELFADWQANVAERIKALERRFRNVDILTIARFFRRKLKVSLTKSSTLKFNFPKNNFTVGHETLSRVRATSEEPDCSNNGHNGTWNGTGITGAQYDLLGAKLSCGTFNGTDNYIEVPDHPDLSFGNATLDTPFSISAWIKPDVAGNFIICEKGSGALVREYQFKTQSSGWLQFILIDQSGSNTLAAHHSPNPIVTGNWQHVVGTYDGSGLHAGLKLYIDGVEVSTGNSSGGSYIAAHDTTANLLVGKDYDVTYADGQIDEFRIYKKELSAAEVANLYLKQHVTDSLELYFGFDNPLVGAGNSPQLIYVSSTQFKFDLSSSDADDSSTAYWDTTNERIAHDNIASGGADTTKVAQTGQCYFGGKNFATATLTATETKFEDDTITYELSADGGSNWESVTLSSAHTFSNAGNDLRMKATFNGNGGTSTYIENVNISFTRS